MSDKPKKEKPKKEKPKKEKVKKEKKPKGEKTVKMKVCPSCQAEIPKKAKICPHCAAKQKSNPLPLILVAVLLVVLAAAASVFVFRFPFDPPFELPFSGRVISETTLGAALELTKKEEEAVKAVLTECGFVEITEVSSLSSSEKFSSYLIDDANTSRFMETDDGIVLELENATKTVTSITYLDNDLYINGHALGQITDYYLDMSERGVYISACLTAVKSRLDIPETAVFPAKSSWEFSTNENHVTVRSSVTAKNTSGVEETRPFVAEFEDGSFVSLFFIETGGEN